MMKASGKKKTEKQYASGGKLKSIIAALAVLLVLLTALLIVRNDLVFFAAERFSESQDFALAEKILSYGSSDRCNAFREYVGLRNEINSKYPLLLEKYDGEILVQWCSTVEELNEQGLLEGTQAQSELYSLSVRLKYVCDADSGFESKEAVIHDLMDVFLEYNRLHIHTNGINTRFTVNEELVKLDEWRVRLEEVSSYAASLPDYEQIYLLSYLISEARGELDELYAAMQAVLDSGYGPDDEIRYSDNSRKSFPVTKNENGISVSLTNKQGYTEQIHAELREHLVSSQLVSFYVIR